MADLCTSRWGAVFVALWGLTAPAAAQPLKKPSGEAGKSEPPKPAVVNVVRQGFPARAADPNDLAKSDTAWEVEWTITSLDKLGPPSSVLAIRSAKFMFKDSAGRVRWFTVLKNLEVGEILVPYDRMEPVFLDVSEHSFRLIPAKPEYLGPACVL
ncbi:MAG: hypothetical protein NZO58_10690, partial [Gemmataceae bacterium]|nr:hypothetical protein [Gemmataceae bacterium]